MASNSVLLCCLPRIFNKLIQSAGDFPNPSSPTKIVKIVIHVFLADIKVKPLPNKIGCHPPFLFDYPQYSLLILVFRFVCLIYHNWKHNFLPEVITLRITKGFLELITALL